MAPYYLEFAEVDNEMVNQALADQNDRGEISILPEYNYTEGQYGYYENVYADLTESMANDIDNQIYTFPGENPDETSSSVVVQDNSPKDERAFSAGEADDFSSGNTSEEAVQTAQSDFDQQQTGADDFSSGDFSSGEESGQDAVSDSPDSGSGNIQDAQNVQSGTENASTDGQQNTFSNGENLNSDQLNGEVSNLDQPDGETPGSKKPKPEKEFKDADNAGKASDPYVYLGENIEQYPYYKYTLISDLKCMEEAANENKEAVENGTFVPVTGAITLQDGQYWYWKMDKQGAAGKYPLSVVTGRQPVSYNDVVTHTLPEDLGYNYYFKVEMVYFCCKVTDGQSTEDPENYTYYGWYYPSYPDENIYLKADGKTPTHYISEAEYKLTPGSGNYEFIPDEEKPEQKVQVNHLYYRGGYTNHDWLKRYVFHLSPEDTAETSAQSEEVQQGDAELQQNGETQQSTETQQEDGVQQGGEVQRQNEETTQTQENTNAFKNFDIQVDTLTVEEFEEKYGTSVTTATSVSEEEAAAAGFSDSSNEQEISSEATQGFEDGNGQKVQEEGAVDAGEIEEQSSEEGNSEVSEVESMTSEAGVELVSIEQEISENQTGTGNEAESENEQSVDVTSVQAEISEESDMETASEKGQISDSTDTNEIAVLESSEAEFTDSANEGDQNQADVAAFSDGDSSELFSAGAVQSTDTTTTALTDYDLIYVNGALTAVSARVVVSADIPCIVNARLLTGTSGVTEAFSGILKEEDADGHYVNGKMYVFKNTLGENSADFINVKFHTNFNPDVQGDFSDSATEGDMEGFEEILEYIESENQYRQIGITDGTAELLSTEISQARAVEYIINYKYKRNRNAKSSINVLEIEPTKSSAALNQEKIDGWLGYTDTNFIKSYSVCCEYTVAGSDYAPKEYLFDGKTSTFWHSDWKNYLNGHPNGGYHHIEVTFKKGMTINGFDYSPRGGSGNGAQNGKIKEFEFHLYSDENCEKELYSEEGSFDYNDMKSDSSLKTFRLADGKAIAGVKSAKIVILSAGDSRATNTYNLSTRYASGAELAFSVPSSTDTNTPKLNLTQKSAAEYVGHIDDISAEYDMIYIGDNVEDRNNNQYLVGTGNFRYVHVGNGNLVTSSKTELLKLLGQLDIEYDASWTGTNGMRRFAPFNTYGEDGGGYFRGSGNDMTEQNYQELMEFVKSGYPVVLGTELITSDRKVDSSKVDAASWYYQFIQEALQYPNVMTKQELDTGQKNITFWLNLAKPVVNFDENGGKPVEPVRNGEVDDGSGKYGFVDGELTFIFTVSNDSSISPATTTYDCDLYLDLNFDGNFSQKELQDKYIQITDEDGEVLSQVEYGPDDSRYELKAGKKYTLTRKIPKDYFKLITWKLEISNNQNTYIHTSETGYSKQTNQGQKQKIKVLQLVPTRCTWTLGSSSKFKKWMNQVDDFEIEIQEKSVTDFGNMSREDIKALLDEKQMLIIGFADVYQDIPNDHGQVEEILNFVKAGKSILFAHDTTSYINYDYNKMYKKIAQSAYTGNEQTETGANVYYDQYLQPNRVNNVTWGLSLNQVLRSVVGMDRYGITSDEKIDENGTTVSNLLKKGRALDSSSVNFKTLMEAAGDIAYQSGDRTKSYGQTQGYTNNLLKQRQLGTGSTVTYTAKKVNDGAITQYPYRIPDTLSVAQTHGQYYQLALERDRDLSGQSDGKTDIVVWYCLSGTGVYDESPDDVRNNYYFYSNKNVIYTGAGHSTVDGDDEIKLFINAIVAAANVTAVQPEVHFIKSLNPAAETENTRYYMTDQTAWTNDERNTLEKDMSLYFNVKDYNMVSADLNPEDLSKQEMTVELYIDNPDGEELNGENVPQDLKGKKVTNITGIISGLRAYGEENSLISVGTDNKFHLTQNNAYSFSISDVEQYLKNAADNGYYTNCKVYIVINSTVYLYGQEKSETSWASIDLKQRQLFEMD